jgi:predicted RNase H-like nuclease (RuvC/YqgF family)
MKMTLEQRVIDSYENQISELECEMSEKDSEIRQLKAQISDLRETMKENGNITEIKVSYEYGILQPPSDLTAGDIDGVLRYPAH